MSSLAEDFPKEQARVRELLGQYKEVGKPGAFAAAMMEVSLRNADQAAISGDVCAMITAYADLKSWEG